MSRRLLLAAPIALLLPLAACSLVYDVGEYATGEGDAGASDSHADSLVDSHVDTGADTAVDSGVDTAVDSATDSGVDSGADTGSDTGADTGTDTGVDAGPFRHTINVTDGSNDFVAANEKLSTTTPSSFEAYVTWDATSLYVGYVGPDVGATASDKKWLLVYLDADPGAATGARKTEQYSSQQHALPAGFGAEAYFGWRTDDNFSQFRAYVGGAWSPVASSGVKWKRNAAQNYVEIQIPFSSLGTTPSKLGVTTLLINETTGGEWTWAGLYSDSFTDGISLAASPLTIAHYLQVDLASQAVPNAVANKK